jgi:hypothetical protein
VHTASERSNPSRRTGDRPFRSRDRLPLEERNVVEKIVTKAGDGQTRGIWFEASAYSSIQNYAENVKKFRLFDLVYIGRLNFASPFVRAFFHRRSTESSPQHTLKPLSAHWWKYKTIYAGICHLNSSYRRYPRNLQFHCKTRPSLSILHPLLIHMTLWYQWKKIAMVFWDTVGA